MDMQATTAGGREQRILEDATGRRARWMKRAGRVVFLFFLAWLAAIVLGGLGLAPVPQVPFTQALRPSQGPPPLARLPAPRPPSASDLRPALPAEALATTARRGPPAEEPARARGRSSLAPGHTKTSPRGRGATAPGHTKTSPRGRSATAPGHTKTTPSSLLPPGHSPTAPGYAKKTTTTGSPPLVPPGHLRTSTLPIPPRRK